MLRPIRKLCVDCNCFESETLKHITVRRQWFSGADNTKDRVLPPGGLWKHCLIVRTLYFSEEETDQAL